MWRFLFYGISFQTKSTHWVLFMCGGGYWLGFESGIFVGGHYEIDNGLGFFNVLRFDIDTFHSVYFSGQAFLFIG
jgi:hypothetical protein